MVMAMVIIFRNKNVQVFMYNFSRGITKHFFGCNIRHYNNLFGVYYDNPFRSRLK